MGRGTAREASGGGATRNGRVTPGAPLLPCKSFSRAKPQRTRSPRSRRGAAAQQLPSSTNPFASSRLRANKTAGLRIAPGVTANSLTAHAEHLVSLAHLIRWPCTWSELAAGTCLHVRYEWKEDLISSFSPCGRRWPEGPDEGCGAFSAARPRRGCPLTLPPPTRRAPPSPARGEGPECAIGRKQRQQSRPTNPCPTPCYLH